MSNRYHNLWCILQVIHQRTRLLTHPVVGSLLDHKWRTFGAPSFFLNLVFYVIFLALFTSLIFVTPLPNGPVCRGTVIACCTWLVSSLQLMDAGVSGVNGRAVQLNAMTMSSHGFALESATILPHCLVDVSARERTLKKLFVIIILLAMEQKMIHTVSILQ